MNKFTRIYKDREAGELASLLQKKADEVCVKYGNCGRAFVYVNTRMVSTISGKWRYVNETYAGEAYRGLIQVSFAVYKIFGLDETIKVLMHELAHHIDYNVYFSKAHHGPSFFRICRELGGVVGPQFAHSGCDIGSFLPKKRERKILAVYVCPCGATHKIKTRKVLDTLYRRHCSICGASCNTFEKIS